MDFNRIKAIFATFFIPCAALVIDFLTDRVNMIDYIPAAIGVPCSAIGAYIIVIRFLSITSQDNYEPERFNSISEIENRNLKPVAAVGLWILCFLALVFAIFFLWPSYNSKKNTKSSTGIVKVTFLQLNDVYEISPVDNGKAAGMARVATYCKQLRKENPNTYIIVAGDFLSPAAIGTVAVKSKDEKDNDTIVMGKQMVEVFNKIGVNLATFGNHEFDISEIQLQNRINMSDFDWVSTNVLNSNDSILRPFAKTVNNVSINIPPYKILTFYNENNSPIKIGILGLTINSNAKNYVAYKDYYASADEAIKALEGKCDFIVALTHLSIAEDTKLATLFPQIKLIMGGHEHQDTLTNILQTRIAKADANARTIYKHVLTFDRNTSNLKISSELVSIDSTIEEDISISAVVDKWNKIAEEQWINQGINPCRVLRNIIEPLDGREAIIRSRSTNLTKDIASAFTNAAMADGVKVLGSIYNSGSIRIDDLITDNVTEYDIIRALPYPGKIFIIDIKGSLLDSILNVSENNHNEGCFLQSDNIYKEGSVWKISNDNIKPNAVYRLAANEFLVTGQQNKMEFLKEGASLKIVNKPNKSNILRYDLRQAVIKYYLVENTPQSVNKRHIPCNL